MSSSAVCVNCRLCLDLGPIKWLKALEQDTRVVSLISERISPRTLTENDFICQTCLNVSTEAVNQNTNEQISSKCDAKTENQGVETTRDIPVVSNTRQRVSEARVCLMCNSNLGRRSKIVLSSKPSPSQQRIADVVFNSLTEQKVIAGHRVCWSCYSKAKSIAIRLHKTKPEETKPVAVPSTNMNNKIEIEIKIEKSDEMEQSDSNSEDISQQKPLDSLESSDVKVKEEPRSELSVEFEQPSDEEEVSATENKPQEIGRFIKLENYRRAPNTCARCVFVPCADRKLQRVSDTLRKRVLVDYHFYLPENIRVCDYHLSTEQWETLYHFKNSLSVFTAKQVEHIFSFIIPKRNTIINFNDPLTIDDHLFRYCFGLTKQKFIEILNDFPQIKTIPLGELGLVAYLIKLKNKDSNERIAAMLGLSRRRLETAMNAIKELLKDSHHSDYLSNM